MAICGGNKSDNEIEIECPRTVAYEYDLRLTVVCWLKCAGKYTCTHTAAAAFYSSLVGVCVWVCVAVRKNTSIAKHIILFLDLCWLLCQTFFCIVCHIVVVAVVVDFLCWLRFSCANHKFLRVQHFSSICLPFLAFATALASGG